MNRMHRTHKFNRRCFPHIYKSIRNLRESVNYSIASDEIDVEPDCREWAICPNRKRAIEMAEEYTLNEFIDLLIDEYGFEVEWRGRDVYEDVDINLVGYVPLSLEVIEGKFPDEHWDDVVYELNAVTSIMIYSRDGDFNLVFSFEEPEGHTISIYFGCRVAEKGYSQRNFWTTLNTNYNLKSYDQRALDFFNDIQVLWTGYIPIRLNKLKK